MPANLKFFSVFKTFSLSPVTDKLPFSLVPMNG